VVRDNLGPDLCHVAPAAVVRADEDEIGLLLGRPLPGEVVCNPSEIGPAAFLDL